MKCKSGGLPGGADFITTAAGVSSVISSFGAINAIWPGLLSP